MEHALMCPQCNAPLAPHRFARSVVCSYCGATVQLDETSLSAAVFHESYRAWNSPERYGFAAWLSLGERHWAMGNLIAQGESADVYAGQLARWPTELVILKVLRDGADAGRFNNEWNALQALHKSTARGAQTFVTLLPQPVLHGEISAGAFAGRRVSIFRWASGFRHTFDEVVRAYPQGVAPRASVWAWRRILELLSFIHASGMAHGAVLPAHLLVQDGEHGVRLVGYGCAGRFGEKLRAISPQYEDYYPLSAWGAPGLSAQLDLAMSARCIAALLGGNPKTAALPASVPPRLAAVVQRVAQVRPGIANEDAWSVREELGRIADEVFGPPQYIPIVMPS
jgi:hypothetical protein